MKNFTKTLWLSTILLFVLANVGWGQVAAWQLYGNSGSETSVNATTLDANLNTSTLARGSGLNASGLVNAFSSTNFTASGTKVDAISNGKYLLFTLNAKTNYKFSLSTLDVRFRRSSTGPNTFRWQYSTDGTTFTDIGSSDISFTAITTGGVAQTQIDLSGITALQNVENATTITIRLLGWGASATAGTFAIGRSLTSGATDYSLSIGGTVTSTGNTAPTVTTQAVSSIGVTSATGNGNITSTGGENATDRGVCWDIYANPDPDLSDAHSTETGSFGTGTFTGSITSVSAETRYKVVAYATNSVGTGYGSAVDFWTLSIEPSAYTTTFSNSVISQVQIDLTFDAASSITNADGYIILQKTGSAPTGVPSDGNAYSVGNTIGDATVAAIITSTSATSTSITGLSAGTHYYFQIMPYNYNGSNNETYNYKTDGTIPGTNGTTSAPNDADSYVGAPGTQVNPGTISSLVDTDGEAIEVFKFKITDVGGDEVQTKVTQVTLNTGSNNTANWSNTIQGVKLSTNGGTDFVTIGTATINESSIVIPITSGNLNINNGGNAEVSLFIYLNTSGLTDNQILEFNIPTPSHGFIADETGSTFASTFPSATTSNQVTINVDATIIKFVQQPSNTNVNETMSPAVTIEATDENGNRDLDKTGDVNLASSGTMTGTPTASLTSGFGTFSNIVHTATGTGLTLTASLVGLTDAVSSTFNIATYTWNASGTASWMTSTNWTPERTSPSTSDVLLFNSGTTVTVTDVPAQTIAMLLVSNSTTVNLQAGAENTLTISGGTGTDLSVDAGCQLNIDGTNALIISLSTGATGSISGSMTFSNAAHKLISADPSGITLNNGSTFTTGTDFSGNAFGTSIENSIIFASGSTYIHQSGSHPFGYDAPKSVVVFQSGSLYKHETSYSPAFSGRTYADFELDITGGTITPTGSSAVVMDNLTVTNGTLNFNVTETPGHSIKGNITISSGATLNFEPTSFGTINLNGSSAQSISGTGTLTFGANSNLEINNSNGISLNIDVTIGGTLTLTSGLLTLGTNNLTLGSSATITGASSSNYIVTDGSGVLKRTVSTSEVLYPIGTSSAYSPVCLTETSNTNDYTITAENDNSGSNNGEDRVKVKWTFNKTTSNESDVTLKIGWMTSLEGTNFANNRATYAKFFDITTGLEKGTGDYTLVTSSEPYALSRGGITSFSPIGIGPGQGALPIELSSFTSSTSDNSVYLTWSTAAELNNSGFDVERKKTESNNWQKIGFVEGHGTTNTPQHYSFSDRFLSTGKYNYRLKQIDFNGNYQYYCLGNEVSIVVPKKFELSQNFPNPFNPVTNISYKLPNDSKVRIIIFDILGREIRTLVDEFKAAGYHTIIFDGSALSSGMYFYRIKTDEFEGIKKMLLVK